MNNSHLYALQSSAVVADLAQYELNKRLSLYQVFLRLYENHGVLLNQILQLENLADSSFTKTQENYIQAVIDKENTYIITNLEKGKSQCLQQSQQIWTIGRHESSGICIHDRYLSRHHGAIQYLQGKGFCLVDFNSTNGSYVNGERIYQLRELQDGDSVRLGTITFSFFINLSTQVLPTVATELLMQLVPKKNQLTIHISQDASSKTKPFPAKLDFSSEKIQKLHLSNYHCAQPSWDHRHLLGISILEQYLTAHQNSEITDNFLLKNKLKNKNYRE